MRTNDLLYYLNKGSLNELLPILTVKTKEDVDKYTKENYRVIEIDKIKEILPDISEENLSHLYYAKCFMSTLMYYDEDQAMLFETSIYVNQDNVQYLQPIEQKSANEILEQQKRRFQNIAWTRLHFHFIPERYRLELLLKNLNKINDEEKYKVFTEIYTSVDYGSEFLTEDLLKRIRELNKEKEDSEEYINVYRGIGDKSNQNGFSYSTNYDIARFFAFRHSQNTDAVKLIEGKVRKKDIVADISFRGENEILILPGDLKERKETILYGIQDFLTDDVIRLFLEKRESFRKAMRHLNLHQEAGGHDENHLIRVLLLSIILSDYYELNKKIAEDLFAAAMFHDIGRTHDDEDEDHGLKSYEKWKTFSEKENDFIRKLMESHSLKEEKEDWFETEEEKTAYKILKDADALDRQRFGLRELNSNFLRLDFSKELSFAAYQLCDIKVN